MLATCVELAKNAMKIAIDSLYATDVTIGYVILLVQDLLQFLKSNGSVLTVQLILNKHRFSQEEGGDDEDSVDKDSLVSLRKSGGEGERELEVNTCWEEEEGSIELITLMKMMNC